MARILDDAEIADLLDDPKPIFYEDMLRLKSPTLGRSERHYMTVVEATGSSGRKYRLTSRRNRHGSTGDPGRSVLELRKTVEVEVTAWQGAA